MENRYLRQNKILPREVLENSTILVAGVGGLGGFSSLYLTLAGVNTIILVDHDKIEESNLNRQVLYRKEDLGKTKVFVAAKRLIEINSDVNIIPINKKIDKDFDIPHSVDVVIDGLDNFDARVSIESFALKRDIPYIFGAVEGFMGMVTFIDHSTKKLKDFIHNFNTETPQVLGTTAALTASIQVMEAFKYLSHQGDLLKNRLLIYDGLSTNFLEVKL